MGAPLRDRFVELCRDVLRPLIEADDGKLYLVSADDNELALHLGGNCAGCPGAPFTIRTLIEPAIHSIEPNVRVVVTVGAKRPDGAILIEPADRESVQSTSGAQAALGQEVSRELDQKASGED